ncbi:hypothetical protein [Streptomyces sp. WAC 01529]|uniref:hypothetical protein n=1 Tax=Streptomyces sp. WAC 01529 TaxID=2203205 RepID=UPI000F744303|nr:hypothetical protein [Streptomyces sp. WAC 01529]
MTEPLRVTPSDGCEIDDWSAVKDALLGVVRHADPAAGESTCRAEGKWHASVASVEVVKRLAGGRGGAQVLEIITRRDGNRQPTLHVAKLMDVGEAVKEWKGYRRLIATCDSNMFVAVTAVSQGVAEERTWEARKSVVVYRHAMDWDHRAEVSMVALEDVIAAAVDGHTPEDECAGLVRQVLASLADSMYARAETQERQLAASFNRSLGFDLCLSVGRVEGRAGDLLLMDGNADAEDKESRRIYSDDVAEESTATPGAKRSLTPGQTVRLSLSNLEVSDDEVRGTLVESAVHVRVKLVGSAKAAASLKRIRQEQANRRSVEVLGLITAVRAQSWSTAMARAFGPEAFTETEAAITYGETRIAHPVGRLASVLWGPADKRSFSPVHRDLNPRNIITLGTTPYLIDFATFEESGATLQDPAWLETCLVRDCLADRLTWDELVRQQRLLGFLVRMTAHWDGDRVRAAAEQVAQALTTDNPRLGRSLLLLWQVRGTLTETSLRAVLGDWRVHYPQHLVLAACKTLKWAENADEVANPHRLRASCAVAGVASESLGPLGEMFADWAPGDAALACEVLLDAGEAISSGAGDLLLAVSSRVEDRALLARVAQGLRRLPSSALSEARQALLLRHLKGPDAPAGKAERPDPSTGQADDLSFTYIALEGHRLPPGAPCVQQGHGALSAASEDCVALVEREQHVVLLSDPGAGKTTVARELHVRLLSDDVVPVSGPLLPLWVSAVGVIEFLRASKEPTTVHRFLRVANGLQKVLSDACLAALIAMGGVHVTVDDLDLVDSRERSQIMVYLAQIARKAPRLRLLVCDRIRDYDPMVLRWPAVAVHKVREGPARDFLRAVLRKRDKHGWKNRFKNLEARLFRDVGAGALRDLAGKPQFLNMLVDQYAGTDVLPSNPGELVHRYLTRLLNDSASSVHVDDLIRLLGAIAKKLDASGALRKAAAEAALEKVAEGQGQERLRELLATPCLDEVAGRVSFRDPLVQSYCGAVALQRYPKEALRTVTDYVLRYGWREAAVLLVTDPETAETTTEAVVRAGVIASPWYGALLMQAAPDSAVIEIIRDTFLREQKDVLRSSDSGVPAWKRSAYALAKYGDRAALEILRDTALAAEVSTDAAEAALDGLVMMYRWFVPDANTYLQEVLTAFLDAPAERTPRHPRLVTRALRSIQVAELHSLVGLAWDRIAAHEPWEVHSQAWETVTHLGVRPDRSRTRAYADACGERLLRLDAELKETAATETTQLLDSERLRLLTHLATCGRLETVLAYRFRFGLADYRDWPQLIDRAAAAQHSFQWHGAAAPTLLLTSDVLRGINMASEQWKRMLSLGDDSLTALAAHHLLAGNVDVDEACLRDMVSTGTSKALLIASAFVHSLPQQMHSILPALLAPYLDELDTESLEAVAALVSATEHLHAETGRQLAWRVHRTLLAQNLDRAALHWPWSVTWRRALLPRAEIGDFLTARAEQSEQTGPAGPAGQDGAEGARDRELLTLLGSADVLLDAPAVKPVSLSQDARRELAALAKRTAASGVRGHKFVLLAASTGLYEELAFVQEAAFDPYNLSTVIRHSHGVHGSVEVSLAAHAITAVGYLSRLKAKDDPGYNAKEDMDEVKSMDLALIAQHPSLARARLISLGYWSVEPLRDALPTEDPILLAALGNIVHHWLPGSQQEADAQRSDIARWLLRATTEMPLTPQTRGTLTDLRLSIEDRLGRYVN